MNSDLHAPKLFTCITKNCEGFRRVSSDLPDIANEYEADLIFISEPHLFQSDLKISTELFHHKYFSSLNSADKFDNHLALRTSRAFGGTLTLWKRSLDPYIKILNVNSSSFNVLLINIPGYPATANNNIYLPTAGRDSDYVSKLSKLENVLDEIWDKHEDPIVILRGDVNASIPARQSNTRDTLFQYFCQGMNLTHVPTNHKTYHHFMGEGFSDSSIDVILIQQPSTKISENILNIICSKKDPRIDSKHDVIVSQLQIPYSGLPDPAPSESPPSIPNTKHRIIWSDDGILQYRDLLTSTLLNIQSNWKSPKTPISYSVLLQCTNKALISAAKHTNTFIDLLNPRPPSRHYKPSEIIAAEKNKNQIRSCNPKHALMMPERLTDRLGAVTRHLEKKNETKCYQLSAPKILTRDTNI